MTTVEPSTDPLSPGNIARDDMAKAGFFVEEDDRGNVLRLPPVPNPATPFTLPSTASAMEKAEADARWRRDLAEAREKLRRQEDAFDWSQVAGEIDASEEDRERSSWAPIDLTEAIDGEDLPPPEILRRVDDVALLYRGKTHWFQGEPESCKTWVAVGAASQVLADGGRVLWVDFEDDERTVVARLKSLGVSADWILERFTYVRPDEPLGDRHQRITAAELDFEALLAGEPFDLAIIDGVTEAMLTEGLNLMDNADIAGFMRRLPRRIADTGAAVVGLDHVVKDAGGRGRWAIGGQHKLAGLSGVAYRFDVVRPFSRANGTTPGVGIITVTVAKDRVGHVRAACVGDTIAMCELTSWPDGRVDVVLRGADASTAIDRVLCGRIADYLRTYEGSTGRKVEEGVEGKGASIRATLKTMAEHGWVHVQKVGQSHQHTLTATGETEFPEVEDA